MVKPEVILKRQISYLIIKETWCIFQGPKTQLALYKKLNMSRQLYSRIMTGQCDTQLDAQAKYCSEITGIDVDIFRGKKIFCVDGIAYSDWEKFFGHVYSKKKTRDYKEFIKKLRYQISLVNKKIQNNALAIDQNLQLMLSFAKYGSKHDMLDNYTRLNDLIKAIENINISTLESVIELENNDNKYLTIEKYIMTLKKQYELVNSVYIYNKNKK